MYKLDVCEADSIPILEIAKYIVPDFINNGHKSTGRCVKHTDNKLGNLRFNIGKNYAHCFTCSTTWYPVQFVMEFKNLTFSKALQFLYELFPSYFLVKHFNTTFSKKNWKGLTNKEYKKIGINTTLYLEKSINIKDFALLFTDEHNNLLLAKIKQKQEEVKEIYENLIKEIKKEDTEMRKKIEKDKKEIEDYLYNLLSKGFIKKKQDG